MRKNGLEYQRASDGKSWVLMRMERHLVLEVSPGAENRPELAEIAVLLHLIPGRPRYEVTVGSLVAPDPARFPSPPSLDLRIVPRSTAQVLFYLSNGVEFPPENICAGLARCVSDTDGRLVDRSELTRGLFEVKVCAGKKRPTNAFIAIQQNGYWYYIDNCDTASKATFMLVFQISRLNFAQHGERWTRTYSSGCSVNRGVS